MGHTQRMATYRKRKQASGICVVGGCREALSTKHYCERHAADVRLYERNRYHSKKKVMTAQSERECAGTTRA